MTPNDPEIEKMVSTTLGGDRRAYKAQRPAGTLPTCLFCGFVYRDMPEQSEHRNCRPIDAQRRNELMAAETTWATWFWDERKKMGLPGREDM